MSKCEICGKGPPDHPIAVYRVNKPGEIPARWRCAAHLTAEQNAALDPEVVAITEIIAHSSQVNKEHDREPL